MSPPEILRLSFSDLGELEREIANNLRYGRLFVGQVVDAPVLTEGVLVIVHPLDGRELRLPAQVVMVNAEGPMRGTGLALRGFGPGDVEKLALFVKGGGETKEESESEHGENSRESSVGEMTEPTERVVLAAPLSRSSFAPPRSSSPPRTSTVPPRNDEDVLDAVRRGPEREARLSDPGVLLGYEMPDPRRAAGVEAVTVRPGGDEGAVTPLMAAEEDFSGMLDSAAPDGGEPALGDDDAPLSAEEELPPPPSAAEDDFSGVMGAESGSDSDNDNDNDEGVDSDSDSDASGGDAPASTELQRENRQERLRSLNATEQLKVARRGELQDRVVVERLYGKQVWEALLSNPRITLPEVARIARKGTVPRPLIESIVENNAWIRADNVRRALLSNPKLTGEGIQKLLRITPRHELKMIEKGTSYPMSVRDGARKLLKDE
ncbi:MAG TPA: hypothetical protein VJV78_45385 [Polyangiales bacterium]|nr:hypothetical protein [Polyangiales bacterium]